MGTRRWAALLVGVVALVLLVAVAVQVFVGVPVARGPGHLVDPIPPGWTPDVTAAP